MKTTIQNYYSPTGVIMTQDKKLPGNSTVSAANNLTADMT